MSGSTWAAGTHTGVDFPTVLLLTPNELMRRLYAARARLAKMSDLCLEDQPEIEMLVSVPEYENLLVQSRKMFNFDVEAVQYRDGKFRFCGVVIRGDEHVEVGKPVLRWEVAL